MGIVMMQMHLYSQAQLTILKMVSITTVMVILMRTMLIRVSLRWISLLAI